MTDTNRPQYYTAEPTVNGTGGVSVKMEQNPDGSYSAIFEKEKKAKGPIARHKGKIAAALLNGAAWFVLTPYAAIPLNIASALAMKVKHSLEPKGNRKHGLFRTALNTVVVGTAFTATLGIAGHGSFVKFMEDHNPLGGKNIVTATQKANESTAAGAYYFKVNGAECNGGAGQFVCLYPVPNGFLNDRAADYFSVGGRYAATTVKAEPHYVALDEQTSIDAPVKDDGKRVQTIRAEDHKRYSSFEKLRRDLLAGANTLKN